MNVGLKMKSLIYIVTSLENLHLFVNSFNTVFDNLTTIYPEPFFQKISHHKAQNDHS
jgi:hypothetical protein